MIKGFGFLEIFVTLTLSVIILLIVISNVTESTKYAKKITNNQQLLESIFHAVDTIRLDLTKCGMRLQEAGKHFNIPLFENTNDSFKLLYGLQSEVLLDNAFKGEKVVIINKNDFFKKSKKVLIYNTDHDQHEFNEIAGTNGDELILAYNLQNDYSKNSNIVAIKEVEYKLYAKENVLKRKLNGGYFQPLTENVTDFYVHFFPEVNSVLYRIEVNKREQVRGYIFLTNMVEK